MGNKKATRDRAGRQSPLDMDAVRQRVARSILRRLLVGSTRETGRDPAGYPKVARTPPLLDKEGRRRFSDSPLEAALVAAAAPSPALRRRWLRRLETAQGRVLSDRRKDGVDARLRAAAVDWGKLTTSRAAILRQAVWETLHPPVDDPTGFEPEAAARRLGWKLQETAVETVTTLPWSTIRNRPKGGPPVESVQEAEEAREEDEDVRPPPEMQKALAVESAGLGRLVTAAEEARVRAEAELTEAEEAIWGIHYHGIHTDGEALTGPELANRYDRDIADDTARQLRWRACNKMQDAYRRLQRAS